MKDDTATRSVIVRNPLGIHMRPAEALVSRASRFVARVEIVRNNQRVDAKSILDILTLGATQGSQLRLEADGVDADEAVAALAELIESDSEPPNIATPSAAAGRSGPAAEGAP